MTTLRFTSMTYGLRIPYRSVLRLLVRTSLSALSVVLSPKQTRQCASSGTGMANFSLQDTVTEHSSTWGLSPSIYSMSTQRILENMCVGQSTTTERTSLEQQSHVKVCSFPFNCRLMRSHHSSIIKPMKYEFISETPNIILQNQVPKGMKKSEQLMQMEATIKKYTSEVHLTEEDLYEPEKKQPPRLVFFILCCTISKIYISTIIINCFFHLYRFVTQIQDQTSLVEMEATKFECQLAPVGDPNMKVEWFYNGKPLLHSKIKSSLVISFSPIYSLSRVFLFDLSISENRFTPIYDFGYVAMNFGWVYPEDSGEYLCRATNLYGMDETKAIIKTTGKPGIIYDSQLPKGMKSIEKIREMEASWQM